MPERSRLFIVLTMLVLASMVLVAANWKVIQENSIEGYHFDYSGPVHKQLVKLIDDLLNVSRIKTI